MFILSARRRLFVHIYMGKKSQYFVDKKDLINEIHKSKMTYCKYKDEAHTKWDEAYSSLEEIKSPQENIVYRIMTDEHVPEKYRNLPGKRGRNKVNFPPFKHYIFTKEKGYKEVLRSHWKHGRFCIEGKLTDNLGVMFLKICYKFGNVPSFRGYTFKDDMINDALLQLVKVGLKYDETKIGSSPFGYLTQIVKNEFLKTLAKNKTYYGIKEDLRAEFDLYTYNKQGSHAFSKPETFNKSINKNHNLY